MSAVGLLCSSIIFLLIVKPALSIITRFSPQGLDLVYSILLESAPLIILLFWTSTLVGVLNAYKIFGIPALSPAIRAVVILVFIYLFKDRIGIHAIPYGYLFGEVTRLVVLAILLKKLNIFHFKLSIGWEPKFSEFFRTSSYQIIGMLMLALTPIINKSMASWLGPGNVSLLEYANRLYMIPTTLISTGLVVVLLSHWSERYHKKGEKELKKEVLKAAKLAGIAGFLLTLLMFMIKDQIVSSVYGFGDLEPDRISEIGAILGFYLLGLTPYFLSQVYVKALLARKDTKSLLITAFFIITGTILLNQLLISTMGITGIALASSIMLVFATGLLMFMFERRTVIDGKL